LKVIYVLLFITIVYDFDLPSGYSDMFSFSIYKILASHNRSSCTDFCDCELEGAFSVF